MSSPGNSFVARGGAWVVGQFLLMTAVIALGVTFHGDWTRPLASAAGAGLLVAGGSFGIAGVLALGRNRTPYPQPRAGSELVKRGVYARVRHPLYTSVMLVSLGWALIWQSTASFVVALALIRFFYAKARRAERWLCEKFPGYPEDSWCVPRFVPRPGKTMNFVCYF